MGKSVVAGAAAGAFLGGVVGFVGEDAVFGSTAAAAFLTAKFLDAGALGGGLRLFLRFEFIEEELAGEEAVHALLAGVLALHLQTGGAVDQHDAGGDFVDVLAAMTARADKGFLDVRLRDAQGGHALGKLVFLLRTDGERAHDVEVSANGAGNPPGFVKTRGKVLKPRIVENHHLRVSGR